MNTPADLIGNLPGYKIPSSHFRIGSKLHITDFYYAKRYFQNSFFASRTAFNLAKSIIGDVEKTPGLLKNIKKGGLSLVGYGLYSELLLCLVEKFLRSKWELHTALLNHCLVLDSDKLQMVKQVSMLKHFAVIVPIASTFSTSVKIQQKIQLDSPDSKPLSPHYNVLYIADGKVNSQVTPLESEFGWKEKRPVDKEIDIMVYAEKDKMVTQKYFLSLRSKWNKIETCTSCFPGLDQNPLTFEQPLFETDRTAVTPTLIFDFPEGRDITRDEQHRDFKITPEMVRYGHHKRNNSHFLFSIDTDSFLTANFDKITVWLKQLKKELKENGILTEFDHVMLVSTCHYSNANFINLVNETVFSSAATIIHYDLANDYIQNFRLVYGGEIAKADKVFFVDDSLKSGSSFFKLCDFVQYTQLMSLPTTEKQPGISGGFWLLNKAQDFITKGVNRRLSQNNGVFAFANLHLQTSLNPDQESPLLVEAQRYEALFSDCFLDSMRKHFRRQEKKLAIKADQHPDGLKQLRHLKMLEATHLIYAYFRQYKQVDHHGFYEFKNTLFSSDILVKQFAAYDGESRFSKLGEQDAAVLKVLTQSPFVQYQPLKKVVFKWVIQLLDSAITSCTNAIFGETFDYDDFEMIKFLIRRAGLMNANFLISARVFDFLKLLFSRDGIYKIQRALKQQQKEESERSMVGSDMFGESDQRIMLEIERKLVNTQDFIIFFAAQVKELLLQNETRGISLEYQLTRYRSERGNTPGFAQLLRVLTYENAILIKRFYEFIKRQPGWRECYRDDTERNEQISDDLTPIIDHLVNQQDVGSYRFENLVSYLNADGYPEFKQRSRQPTTEPLLLNYLWLEYFFGNDRYRGPMPAANRADIIMQKMKQFVELADENVSKVGAFLIVESGEEKFLVYNRDHQHRQELDEDKWSGDHNRYLISFLNGEKDASETYNKTIVELSRPSPGAAWQDMYGLDGPVAVGGLSASFLGNHNHLILLRIEPREKNSAGNALMGIYFVKEDPQPMSTGIIKYFLLIRRSFSRFINAHFENNEYRDWWVAERTRRFVLLSGHGKETLHTLSGEPEMGYIYIRIVNNLQQLQQIVLSASGQTNANKTAAQDTFQQFYYANGQQSINDEFISSLDKLARNIYSTEVVENKVIADLKVSGDPGINFAFSRNVIEILCFELFVNAKKNRWHNLPDDQKKRRNALSCSFNYKEVEGTRQLVITVTSTGPKVSDEHLRMLNDPYNNVKRDDPVSGTHLIKTLVRDYLGGSLNFTNGHRKANESFGKFVVSITLNEQL